MHKINITKRCIYFNKFYFRDLTIHELVVKVGGFWFNDQKNPRRFVSHIINHPLYDNRKNDIALIRLVKPVNFTNDVKPICLPDRISDSEILKTFSYCVQSSFGYIDRGMRNCLFLHEVKCVIL